MKIKHWMTPDPITVTPETLVIDARDLMKDNNIRRLPVVDKGRLVGIITYKNIIEASPSAATTLSKHELNYLLLKLQVKEIMRKNPLTVSPDESVPDAILRGTQKGIGSFPVVDKDGTLVGIITETEIFRAMIHIFGTKSESEIIELVNVGTEDSIGDFRKIAEVLEKHGVPIIAMFSMVDRDTDKPRVYVRVKTRETKALLEDLGKAGFHSGD